MRFQILQSALVAVAIAGMFYVGTLIGPAFSDSEATAVNEPFGQSKKNSMATTQSTGQSIEEVREMRASKTPEEWDLEIRSADARKFMKPLVEGDEAHKLLVVGTQILLDPDLKRYEELVKPLEHVVNLSQVFVICNRRGPDWLQMIEARKVDYINRSEEILTLKSKMTPLQIETAEVYLRSQNIGDLAFMLGTGSAPNCETLKDMLFIARLDLIAVGQFPIENFSMR